LPECAIMEKELSSATHVAEASDGGWPHPHKTGAGRGASRKPPRLVASPAAAAEGTRVFITYFRQSPEEYGGINVEFDKRMYEMDTLEAIRKRRSIRRYTDDTIPKADLETIVDAGRLAATGNNRQPWDFVVVTDRTMIERFKVSGAWIEKAGAVIVVVMDPVSRWWVEDGAAAIENMLLASTALGYGACWVEGDALTHEALFKTLLDVPTEKRVMALIPIGLAAEMPTQEKKPLEKVLHWERY